MATAVANNLQAHYSGLATSTQRLSTGLRVNSAADDAAGLAIRELMRTDISVPNQGGAQRQRRYLADSDGRRCAWCYR